MKMLKKMKTAVGLLLATSMIISCTPSALAQSTTKKTMFSSQKDVSKSSTVSIFSVKPDYEDSNPHIAICWFDSDKSHTNYRVYRSKGDNLHYKELDISYTNTFYGSEKMFFAHDNPDFGYTYYYKVMPYTQNTPGEMSSELSTSYEYEMGDDVIVGLDKSKRPVLYFMNITRFTQKRAIYRATSKNGKYKKIAVTAKHCYYDKKAKKGKKHYYKVKGCYFDGKKTRLSKFSKTAVFNQQIGIINKIRIYRKLNKKVYFFLL